MDIHTLFNSTPEFNKRLLAALVDLDMLEQCLGLEMDHICIRLDTDSSVQLMHRELLAVGTNISTAMVHGRLIHLIKLNKPLQIGPWSVGCVELPYPHPDKPYVNGWEHVEFVLLSQANTMEALQDSFDEMFPRLSSEHMSARHERRDSLPNAEGDQLPNPTIALTKDDVGIKFHPLSIQEVVA